MLPRFPVFKKIELNDFSEIEKINNKFPPYNDFEFVSLWTYNTENKNSISILNDNLVIKIQDFLTGELFYSFLGCNKLKDTIETLINRSKEENLERKLHLVPEVNFSIDGYMQDFFIVEEDPDNFDYILSVEEIALLSGKKYYDKRNLVNRFHRLYPNHIVKNLDLTNRNTQEEIKSLFNVWETQKGHSRNNTIIELTAIEKLFELTSVLNILTIGVYFDNKLIGFSTYHVLQEQYGIMTFEKADSSYEGIFAFLNQQTALHLQKLGCKYLNYEQDLGIPGLKKAKALWRPIFYLKKYTITGI